MNNETRIVITGIGLTAPNGNNLTEFRQNLLAGKSGIGKIETHYMGEVIAGICHFDPLKYQKKKKFVAEREQVLLQSIALMKR